MADTTLGSAKVKIMGDLSHLKKALKKAKGITSFALGGIAGGLFKGFGLVFKGIGLMIKGILKAIGAVIKALIKMAKYLGVVVVGR